MSIAEHITAQLATLNPAHLDLVNQSYKHNVPEGSESHFLLVLVSNNFDALSNVQRHQLVFKTLGDTMQTIHALSMRLYTPEEWKVQHSSVADTPECMHANLSN